MFLVDWNISHKEKKKTKKKKKVIVLRENSVSIGMNR